MAKQSELQERHRERPWRVHTLAADFRLLDVWQFELDGELTLDRFLDVFWATGRDAARSRLARLRVWLGRVFGWDKEPHTLPIPGCSETTLADRLTAADRASSRTVSRKASPLPAAEAIEIYRFENEALYEVSNDTIHALLHVAVADGTPVLAVYIKSRGWFSKLYMAGIAPFRHLFVYPALIAGVERRWATSSAS